MFPRSKIRVEHDAISRLAGLEALERFVDSAHRKMFGLRRDIVPRGKIEHRFIATGEPTGEPEMLRCPMISEKTATVIGFYHEANEVHPAVGGQRGDQASQSRATFTVTISRSNVLANFLIAAEPRLETTWCARIRGPRRICSRWR